MASAFPGPARTAGNSAWRDSKAEDTALGACGTRERLKSMEANERKSVQQEEKWAERKDG